ncbi:MAG: hypothetical protein KJT03_00860 [Verrucomicrobiae bacterium]|nr:hypothetical protein [Verrucomicrobiae bacterium]
MNKEFLINKVKDNRVLILGLLIAAVLAGVYIFRAGPAEALKAEYASLNDEVDLLLANERNGEDLDENLEKIRQYTALMNDRFISQNLADIHDVFYTLERESGVTLDSFQRPEMTSESIKPTGNEQEYQPLSMAVTISGSFKNVLKFVQSLENSPLLYRYSTLKVSTKTRAADEADAISLTLNLELLSLNNA